MGWAVGDDDGRFIGYGVPATCDQPGCGASIDRGVSYACGGGVTGTVENCGRFFCSNHLPAFVTNADDGGEWVCDRCAAGEPPHPPTPDVPEWTSHILTDDSWATWRAENPERVAQLSSNTTPKEN